MYIELHTARLLLRPLGTRDLATTHAYAGNARNTRYMLFLPNDTREQTRQYLARVTAEWHKESPAFYVFAILYQGGHIGEASVAMLPDGCGELAWILHSGWQHRGFATEAAAAVRDFAFCRLGLGTLRAHCDARNAASARLMERLGMRLADRTGTRTYPKTGETAAEWLYTTAAAAVQMSP